MSGTIEQVGEAWIRSLPKAEVHVHLEGGFELIDLLELAHVAGERLPGPARTLFDLSTHDDGLSGFLRFLDWECGLVQTAEQAARHAYTFAARQSASGIRYADAIVNPTHWGAWRGRTPQLIAAFGAGFDEAEQDGLCSVNLAVSILRQQSPDDAADLARWIARDRPHRVVALSVDGDERTLGRDGARFAEAFSIARDAGIRRTVHAGESSGPESVWDAIEHLHAERIDHGVRAVEDERLVRHLTDTGVALNLCPGSNVALGLYPTLAEHPLPRLLAAGVTITVNTDDPAPLRTTLEAEWAASARAFDLGHDGIVRLARASIATSFATDEVKADLLRELDTATVAA